MLYTSIKSLFTNTYSSLIQFGSCPCMVCIVWHVVGDCEWSCGSLQVYWSEFQWWDNNAKTCRSYVRDSTNKIQKSAFVGVTQVSYFVTMHGISNVKENFYIYSYKNQNQSTDKCKCEEQNILLDLPIDFTDENRIHNRHMSTHILP